MAKSEKSEQELMMKFSMFEQQIRLIQDQLQAVEQKILELKDIELGLEELIGKANSEIYAPVGSGIYVKAKLESEELLVNVGGRNLISKDIPETRKILQEQIKKLEGIRGDLNKEMDKINDEVTKVFMEHKENN